MRYYAAILPTTYVCMAISEVTEEEYQENLAANGGIDPYENQYSIKIDSYDSSLIYRKKFIGTELIDGKWAGGTWVDCLPSETGLAKSTEMVHMPDDRWLSEAIGKLSDLKTNTNESIVAAINELNEKITQLRSE